MSEELFISFISLYISFYKFVLPEQVDRKYLQSDSCTYFCTIKDISIEVEIVFFCSLGKVVHGSMNTIKISIKRRVCL